MHWKGGEVPPPTPPTRPAYAQPLSPLTADASLNGICNRQYPPPTASATSSNRLSNRLWGRSEVPSLLLHAWACVGMAIGGGPRCRLQRKKNQPLPFRRLEGLLVNRSPPSVNHQPTAMTSA